MEIEYIKGFVENVYIFDLTLFLFALWFVKKLPILMSKKKRFCFRRKKEFKEVNLTAIFGDKVLIEIRIKR